MSGTGSPRLAGIALMGCAGLFGSAASMALPSLEDLAASPQFGAASLSPDGRHVAIARPNERGSTVVIVDADTLQPTTELTFPRNQHVTSFHWANSEMLVVGSGTATGSLGGPRWTGELFSVATDGTRQRYLFGHQADRSRRNRGRAADAGYGYLISTLPASDGDVLIGSYVLSPGAGIDWRQRIHRVNVYTGSRTQLTQAPMESAWITADQTGALRFANGEDEQGEPQTYRYEAEAGNWQRLSLDLGELGGMRPLEFTTDGAAFYALISRNGEPGCVYLVQVSDLTRRRLTCEEHAEPAALMPSSLRGTPLGAYYDTGLPRVHLFNPDSEDGQLYAALSEQFPSEFLRFLEFSDDGKRLLFEVFSDRDAGRLYLFDRDRQHARPLYRRHLRLDYGQLATTTPISLTARDGVHLDGLLTLPPGQEARNLPLVVHPHGGPYGIVDFWRFDANVQALATRGYAVLRVNFRGSGRRGERFLRLGYREWGGTIQDDIVDATRYLIDQGVADPKRICTLGGSFGAYSALMSAIRAPDLYRCAIGYAGVYDLETMFNRGRIRQTAAGRRYLDRVLGRDPEELAQQSPAAQADRLQAEVLLLHGGADVITPIAHARSMRQALRAAGKEPEWFVVQDEGHGFFRADNRRAYYERVLAFLERHIGSGE